MQELEATLQRIAASLERIAAASAGAFTQDRWISFDDLQLGLGNISRQKIKRLIYEGKTNGSFGFVEGVHYVKVRGADETEYLYNLTAILNDIKGDFKR